MYEAEDKLPTLEEKEAFDLDGKVCHLLKKIVDEVTDGGDEVPSGHEGGNNDEASSDVEGGDSEDDPKAANEEKAANEQTSEKANEDSDSGRTEDEKQKQVQLKEALRVQTMEGQQQQSCRVNAARGKEFKEVLDIGDISSIRMDATIGQLLTRLQFASRSVRCNHTPAQQVKSPVTSTRFAQVRVT